MPLNMQKVRSRRAQIQKNEEERKKGKHFDTLKEGPNYRRVMPPWEGSDDWRKYAAYHFNILEKEAVLCPKKTYNKPCPICDWNEELYASEDKQDKADAKQIRAKDRFFCNVLDLDKNDSKVYILQFGQTVEEQIIAIMDPDGKEDEDGKPVEEFGYGDITDPMTGRTLLITKTVPQDPTQTSYEVKAAITGSKVANWDEIQKTIHNLDEHVSKDEYSFEDLQAMVNGTFVQTKNHAGNTTTPAAETKSSPKEEFGSPAPKNETKTETKVSDSFEAPKNMAPANKVADAQPAKTMSAIDRLKAKRAAEGK